ncbi:ABC transporter permease [Streptomyces sp. NPDC088726]|uniref:ABC transporter permease n=1 Tax=Streptomyces sp. NPDC088726 TaxID=3365874 RepID=UPI00381FBD54
MNPLRGVVSHGMTGLLLTATFVLPGALRLDDAPDAHRHLLLGPLAHICCSSSSWSVSSRPEPAPLWFGRTLSVVLNSLLISASTLTAACLLLGLRIPVGAIAGPAAGLLAAAVEYRAFGLGPGALGLRFRDVFLISHVATSALLPLTGVNVPRKGLPEWMRAVGAVLPLTSAAGAARQLSEGAGPDVRALAAGLGARVPDTGCSPSRRRRCSNGGRRRATLDVS